MAQCALTNHKHGRGNKISIQRSKVARRTLRTFDINIITKHFSSKYFGNIKLDISNRTYRTIFKYGGLEEFLCNMKRGSLSDLGRKMRSKIYSIYKPNKEITKE